MFLQKVNALPKVEKSARNEANLKISEQSKSELLSNYVRNGTKPQAQKNTPGNLEINRNKLNLGPLRIDSHPNFDPKLNKMTLTPDQIRGICNQNFRI